MPAINLGSANGMERWGHTLYERYFEVGMMVGFWGPLLVNRDKDGGV